MTSPDTLPTRVGKAIEGDNLFRGYSTERDLIGRWSFWQLIALAIDGPRLSERDVQVLDLLTSVSMAADPHIWPLKMVRVAGAYGGLWSSLCSTFMLSEGANVGPSPCARAARVLKRLEAMERDAPETPFAELVERVCEEYGPRVPGFGVPGREHDERVLAIEQWLIHHHDEELDEATYWPLLKRMQPIMRARYGVEMNLLNLVVAFCLDLGFDEEQVEIVGFLTVMPCYLANAYESAVYPESRMSERLNASRVRYVGKSIEESEPAAKPSLV